MRPGKRGGPLQERANAIEPGPIERKQGQTILRNLEASASLAHLAAQLRDLGNRHTRIAGHNDHRRLGEHRRQLSDEFTLLYAIHIRLQLAAISGENPTYRQVTQDAGTIPDIFRLSLR